jgi:hypothetical protein
MIEKHDGKNAAGISKLYLILQDKIIEFGSYKDGVELVGNITSSEAFTEIKFLPGTCSFSESSQSGSHGEVFEQNIEFLLNKDAQSITAALKAFTNRKLVAIILDNNGVYRVIGSDQEAVRLTFSIQKDGKIGGPNTYLAQLRCIVPHPAYYYSGTVIGS